MSQNLLPVDKITAAKFASDGHPRRYPGITISAPLDRDPATMDQFETLIDNLQTMVGAEAFSFLPSQCWHMTVLRGVNLNNRRTGPWPQGISRFASLSLIERRMAQRIRHVALPPRLTLHPANLAMTSAGDIRLALRGADLREKMRLNRLRRRLQQALRHSSPSVSGELHVTLAYRVQPIDRKLVSEIETCLEHAPTITIPLSFGRPVLLAYRDMWDFVHGGRSSIDR